MEQNYESKMVIREVTLTLNESQAKHLGFSLVGGGGHSVCKDRRLLKGIFIKTILPHGLAKKSGKLFEGDEILEVNEVVVNGKNHREVAEMIKTFKSHPSIKFKVRTRIFDNKESRIDGKSNQRYTIGHSASTHQNYTANYDIKKLARTNFSEPRANLSQQIRIPLTSSAQSLMERLHIITPPNIGNFDQKDLKGDFQMSEVSYNSSMLSTKQAIPCEYKEAPCQSLDLKFDSRKLSEDQNSVLPNLGGVGDMKPESLDNHSRANSTSEVAHLNGFHHESDDIKHHNGLRFTFTNTNTAITTRHTTQTTKLFANGLFNSSNISSVNDRIGMPYDFTNLNSALSNSKKTKTAIGSLGNGCLLGNNGNDSSAAAAKVNSLIAMFSKINPTPTQSSQPTSTFARNLGTTNNNHHHNSGNSSTNSTTNQPNYNHYATPSPPNSCYTCVEVYDDTQFGLAGLRKKKASRDLLDGSSVVLTYTHNSHESSAAVTSSSSSIRNNQHSALPPAATVGMGLVNNHDYKFGLSALMKQSRERSKVQSESTETLRPISVVENGHPRLNSLHNRATPVGSRSNKDHTTTTTTSTTFDRDKLDASTPIVQSNKTCGRHLEMNDSSHLPPVISLHVDSSQNKEHKPRELPKPTPVSSLIHMFQGRAPDPKPAYGSNDHQRIKPEERHLSNNAKSEKLKFQREEYDALTGLRNVESNRNGHLRYEHGRQASEDSTTSVSSLLLIVDSKDYASHRRLHSEDIYYERVNDYEEQEVENTERRSTLALDAPVYPDPPEEERSGSSASSIPSSNDMDDEALDALHALEQSALASNDPRASSLLVPCSSPVTISSSASATTSPQAQALNYACGVNTLPRFTRSESRGSIASLTSVVSLASSTSYLSPHELQQLIDEANQSLDESGTSDHEIQVVILHREAYGSGIGVTLAGGVDQEQKEVRIHKIIAGSVADRDARARKGDRVLSINGKAMKNLSHRQSVEVLKNQRPEVVLVLARPRAGGGDECSSLVSTNSATSSSDFGPGSCNRPTALYEYSHRAMLRLEDNEACCHNLAETTANDESIDGPLDDSQKVQNIWLDKQGPSGLGFSVEGGRASLTGDKALTVKRIFKGGTADLSGTIFAGDEILEINGKEMNGLTHFEAWAYIKNLPEGKINVIFKSFTSDQALQTVQDPPASELLK